MFASPHINSFSYIWVPPSGRTSADFCQLLCSTCFGYVGGANNHFNSVVTQVNTCFLSLSSWDRTQQWCWSCQDELLLWYALKQPHHKCFCFGGVFWGMTNEPKTYIWAPNKLVADLAIAEVCRPISEDRATQIFSSVWDDSVHICGFGNFSKWWTGLCTCHISLKKRWYHGVTPMQSQRM